MNIQPVFNIFSKFPDEVINIITEITPDKINKSKNIVKLMSKFELKIKPLKSLRSLLKE